MSEKEPLAPLKRPDIKKAKELLKDKHPLQNSRIFDVLPFLGGINFSKNKVKVEDHKKKENHD